MSTRRSMRPSLPRVREDSAITSSQHAGRSAANVSQRELSAFRKTLAAPANRRAYRRTMGASTSSSRASTRRRPCPGCWARLPRAIARSWSTTARPMDRPRSRERAGANRRVRARGVSALRARAGSRGDRADRRRAAMRRLLDPRRPAADSSTCSATAPTWFSAARIPTTRAWPLHARFANRSSWRIGRARNRGAISGRCGPPPRRAAGAGPPDRRSGYPLEMVLRRRPRGWPSWRRMSRTRRASAGRRSPEPFAAPSRPCTT